MYFLSGVAPMEAPGHHSSQFVLAFVSSNFDWSKALDFSLASVEYQKQSLVNP